MHLYERDCSIQRRHQKIIEEAPAIGITDQFRKSIHDAAIEAARAVGYVNAGTVEFLVDAETWEFFFMEMNTRLQVEHPVSEAVTGVDLVEWQLRIAAGEELRHKQEDIKCTGHALEVRLYAENPYNDFLPATGTLHRWRTPMASEFDLTNTVRVDSGVSEGDSVTDYYDPMIAKVVTIGSDRTSAISSMQDTLGNMQIAGLPTNTSFVQSILGHQAFIDAEIETNFIPKYEGDLFTTVNFGDLQKFGINHSFALASMCAMESAGQASGPWSASDGYRSNMFHVRPIEFSVGEETLKGDVEYLSSNSFRVTLSNNEKSEVYSIKNVQYDGSKCQAEINGTLCRCEVMSVTSATEKVMHVWNQGEYIAYKFPILNQSNLVDEDDSKKSILSPMPGRVVQVFVENGQKVKKGDAILALEAMKMEYMVKASMDGIIEGLSLHADSKVQDGTVLATILNE